MSHIQHPIFGLVNLGNTCFCNATLQGIFRTPKLIELLAIHSSMEHSCKLKVTQPASYFIISRTYIIAASILLQLKAAFFAKCGSYSWKVGV